MSNIFEVVSDNDLAHLKRLIEQKANIEAKGQYGDTPLIKGSWKGHLEIVKYLVSMKANIEAKDQYGNTPLIKCSWNGRLEIVKYLVSMKANIEAKDQYDVTPLMMGVRNDHLETVKYLVSMKANIEAKDMFGRTLLSHPHSASVEVAILIKQEHIRRRIQVFDRDLTDLHMLSAHLKRALGAPPPDDNCKLKHRPKQTRGRFRIKSTPHSEVVAASSNARRQRKREDVEL